MKKLVIMPGGFHPFHAGHMALYNSARRAFPDADVYVAATNDTSERPFPFAIKEKLAKLAGVEAGHFVQVKSPFQAREITQNYDPETTALIFVRSEKDRTKPPQAGGTKKDGSPAYLQPITAELNPMNKNGYMAYLPTVEFGPGMTSATEIRTAWPKLNDKRKTALVMSLYPKTQSNPKLAQTVIKMLDTAIGSEQGMTESKSLTKKVKIVKGPDSGKTGWIREIKHGAFNGAPKTYYVDLDDGGQANNLPGTALRLVKQQGVAEASAHAKEVAAKRKEYEKDFGKFEPTDQKYGVAQMIKDIATSTASPEHKKAAIDALNKKGMAEAAYPGNIGIMELAKFFDIATLEEKTLFKQLMNVGEKNKAWKLIQKVTGVKLQGKEFAEQRARPAVAEGSDNIEISDDKSIVTISVDGKDRFMLQPAEGHKLKSYGGGTYKYWTIYDIERKKNRSNSATGMMSKNQAIAYVKKLVRLENKSQQAVKEGSLADAAKHVKKGALHKQEHIPLDKKIGATKLKSLKAHGTPLERKRANFALNIQGIKENAVQLSIQQLATVSDAALDNAYHYGRSSPGNTFGWQANLKSAEFAKRMIDAGVTDIEKISDAIHKGWNVTAKAFVQNPEQFDDTEKLKAAGKLEAKLQQRAKLMNIEYAQLPNDEQEKDRVVAGALLQALKGQTAVDEDAVTDLEHDMKPHSNYTAIDHLMKYLAAKHKITPEELHDKFVNKHGMIPDEWIKDKPMSENDFDDSYDSGVRFDYDEHTARMARLKQKALASQKLKAQGKKPVTRLNPKTGKYYVDFTAGPDYVDEDPFRG